MKKIIQRTRGFEKSFIKLTPKLRGKFIKCLEIFLEDEFAPALKTHQLKQDRKGEWSFSVAHDVRAIYRKEILDNKMVVVFTFVDIGSHSRVY